MKKTLKIFIVLALFAMKAKSQILSPVSWSYAAKKTSATEAVVFLKATIEEGWHVYSQTVKEGGPIKTTFTFKPSAEYALVGRTIEPKPVVRMERVFSMDVAFFEGSAIFQQKVKLKKGQATVKGSLEYMTCNDKQCLPPTTEEFSIPIK